MIHKRTLMSLAIFALAALLASPAIAQDPYEKPDDSWISISGTVGTVFPQSFTLDYGDGIVTVEMDDWDHDADAYKLMQGDEVVVTGRIDDDLFESTKIEAGTVYVEDLNTYFYASAADEEGHWAAVTTPIVISETTVVGTVTSVDGREFQVDTMTTDLTVDTREMAYNPLDEEGFQQIEVGDRVRVSGDLETEFFLGRELMADSVITLSNGGSS